jgi:major type 1 subunit fimbrin (pilin)
MNKKVLALCGLALLAPMGMVAADTVTIGNAGVIQFTGRLVNAACAVEQSSISVVMGQVRTAQFAALDGGIGAAGTPSKTRVPFDIVLNDCDPNVSGNASISFSTIVENEPDITSLAGSDTFIIAGIGSDSSSGVALQIFDLTGNPVVVNGVAQSVTKVLSPGQNTLSFDAGYISVLPSNEILAGDASANVDFAVNYF